MRGWLFLARSPLRRLFASQAGWQPCRLTSSSIGQPKACCAAFGPPLMSDVRRHSMLRPHKLLLFYAAVVLGAFDANALVQRLLLVAPEPLAWGKIALALLLQAAAFAIACPYLWFIVRARKPLVERNPIPFFPLNLMLAPLIPCGLIAGLSVAVLFNGLNCGSYPLPVHRGMALCPR